MDPRQLPPPNPMYAQQPSSNASQERIASPAPLRPATAAMNRAEVFEDEKRRIMSSCFAKKDEKGHLMQSYITHIRVEEDGQYPSAPPPPDASAQHKKNRVIIVAVKNTGRVWMHKARENEDSTFQIGKSWPLEELQGIQSFSPSTAQTPEEQQRSQWAGPMGFIIIMTKPYYWRAKSTKEKEFFIGSLVKIYGKYTSGNVPQLVGFEPSEKDSILRGVQQSTGRAPTQLPARTEGSPAAPQSPIRSDYRAPAEQRRLSNDQRPGSASRPAPPSSFENGPNLRPQVSADSGMRQIPTPDRQAGSRMQSPASFASSPRLAPQGSREPTPSAPSPLPSSRSIAQTTGPAIDSNENLTSTLPKSSPPTQVSQNSRQSRSRQGQYGASSDSLPIDKDTKGRPLTPNTPAANGAPQMPPERRRPPLQGSVHADNQQSSKTDLRPTSSPEQATTAATQSAATAPAEQAPPARPPKLPPDAAAQPVTTAPADDGNQQSRGLESQSPANEHEQNYRPGLGPMMGKKPNPEIASKFRKAANVYNAFKPRAGGAGERLLGAKTKPSDGPDGVTGVVPAPSSVRSETPDSTKARALETPPPPRPSTPQRPNGVPDPDIAVVADSQDVVDVEKEEPPKPVEPFVEEQVSPSVQKPPAKSSDRVIQKRRSNLFNKSLLALGIDPWILEGKEQEYEEVLREFGWDRGSLRPKQLEAMEMNLKREIGRMEAGGWLGHAEQKDERVDVVERMLDKAIAECDEMEGLLTLYGVELGTLHDDIAYIETQSQGLQVQTANQKLLQTELQRLVKTISLTTNDLEPLRKATIGDFHGHGLQSIESTLVMLYQALSTIDPSLVKSQNHVNLGSAFGDDALSNMRALRDKKGLYVEEASRFLERLRIWADPTFHQALLPSSTGKFGGADSDAHAPGRNSLWPLNPLMLFAKEIDTSMWDEITRAYVGRARPIYQNEIANSVLSWKKRARRGPGEEQEALFTTQEKEMDGLSGTARKLTVKRSATLARGLKAANLDKRSVLDKAGEGSMFPSEAFSYALDEIVPLITHEQHFFVDFFHAHSLENVDFIDAVNVATPAKRNVPDLNVAKPIDPNRNLAKRVTDAMEEIFGTWTNEMQGLADWATSSDPFQGIAVLSAVERKRNALENSSQEFITLGLQKIHERLCLVFARFVDEQIRAIEDTKVKIKKRKGVITFTKVFPHFSALVESMLPPPDDPEKLEVRSMVDDAYNRINKAMFDSLKIIAKESPVAGTAGFGSSVIGHSADPEDKEALNYHILLIENMFHFYSEVEERGDEVLGKWRGKAMLEMSEHQELYVKAVVRRPLGKLLDFIESTETLLTQAPGREAPTSLPTTHPSHSRSAFKKILGSYDAKELRRGVDALKKRVEKHFAESDDPSISHKLVTKVLDECERHYVDVYERVDRIVKDVYEGTVEAEFGRTDIAQAFRR